MSVRKRGDTWVAVVYDRRTRRNQWIGTYPTKGEARDAEAEAIRKGKRGRSRETVDEFAARWITDYPRPKDSTNEHYASQVKGFAKEFRGRPLDGLTAAEVERWALAHRGQAKVLRTMYSDALRARLISENPFTGLRLGLPSKGRRDIAPPTEDEVSHLAEVAHDRYGLGFHAFVMCAAYMGARPGELLALEWDHFDFRGDEVEIGAQYTRRGRTTSPKNGRSRTVALLQQAKDALSLVAPQEGHVFRALNGDRLRHSSMNQYWQRVREDAGMETTHLYSLRHFNASYLLNTLELAPQDVAAQLGHTDGGVLVQRLYGHPSDSLARTRIKRANEARVGPGELRIVGREAS